MNLHPSISVIMSVYNGEKYLKQAVDSILKQTFAEFEFIIIEDASTDRTLEILEHYASQDPRIIIIKKEKNKGHQGFIENLNIGLKNAKGKYIARMDADDISELDRFEKQIDFLQKNKNIFMVGSDIQFIDENGANLKSLPAYKNNEEIQKNMFKNISMFHPVIFFRNNKKIFYREKMYYCEDYDLYFRLMTENYKFANIPESLLKYRILTDSISRKDNKLTRWLFVEKARTFFLEQQKNGKDSYETFESENILNILKLDHHNDTQDLLFAAKISLKYQDYDSLNIILTKAKKYFPNDNKFNVFRWYLKTPKIILPYLTKLTLR